MAGQYISRLRTKRGKYASTKAKTFPIMMDGEWLSCRQLCLRTGIDYYVMGTTLPRWVDYGYVSRRVLAVGGDYEYRIKAPAKSWLRYAMRDLPNFPVFRKELHAWQSKVTQDDADVMMALPFTDFVSTLKWFISKKSIPRVGLT